MGRGAFCSRYLLPAFAVSFMITLAKTVGSLTNKPINLSVPN